MFTNTFKKHFKWKILVLDGNKPLPVFLIRWKYGQSYPLQNGLSMLTTWLPAPLPIW